MSAPKLDLAWGDPEVVRQALRQKLGRELPQLNRTIPLFEDMGYPPHRGLPALQERMRALAERQSGRRPKHLFVTVGATGALGSALAGFPAAELVAGPDVYFPFYPGIFKAAKKGRLSYAEADEMVAGGIVVPWRIVRVVDSPSNPGGWVSPDDPTDVWDAAYGSATYGGTPGLAPNWKVMCGSLSKTLGLPGLRLGWVATDDDVLAEKIGEHVDSTTCGVAVEPQLTALAVLRPSFNLDSFERLSRGYLDDNRTEASRVSSKFGQLDPPPRGMFFTLQLGPAERRALERAGCVWQPGPSWGRDDSWARFSLGRDRKVLRQLANAL